MYSRLFRLILGGLSLLFAGGAIAPAWAGATCDQLAAQANNTWASLTSVLPGGTNSSHNTTLGSGGDLAPGEVLIFQVIPGPNFASVINATSDVSVGLLINGSNVFQFRTKVATTREFTIPAGATFPATVLFGILNFEATATLSGELRIGCRNSAGGDTGDTGDTGDGSSLTQFEKSQTVGNLVQTTLLVAAAMESSISAGKEKAAALLFAKGEAKYRLGLLRELELKYAEIEFQIKDIKEIILEIEFQRRHAAVGGGHVGNPFILGTPQQLEIWKERIEAGRDDIKNLKERLAIINKQIKEIKFLMTGHRSIEGDLPRVISLGFVPQQHTGSWPTTNFGFDLDRALNLGDGMTFDLWLKGSAAFLNDSSSANRDGYALRFALGGAYKLSDNFAVSAQIAGGPGRVRIKATNSQTTYNSYGLSMSGIMRFDDHLYGSITGFAERNSHDIEFGPVTGSFDQTTYGVSADVAGSYWLNALHFEPSAFAYYKHSDRDGFMDSGGTWIAGANDNFGRFGAALKVGRAFEGDGFLTLFKPYVSGRLNYNFNQQNSFNIGQGIFINDNRFNAEIGSGIEAYFKRGILGTISINYSGLGGDDLSVLSVNGGLKIPF